ncbi:hypothetical protein AAF712_006207 [Marasmius tenuissimus]|uniref:Uncharacterized protein n=1 Tax=Marasmius tenuissimus TaxID=585030 RepID=A0ABR3A2K4_9AGAR
MLPKLLSLIDDHRTEQHAAIDTLLTGARGRKSPTPKKISQSSSARMLANTINTVHRANHRQYTRSKTPDTPSPYPRTLPRTKTRMTTIVPMKKLERPKLKLARVQPETDAKNTETNVVKSTSEGTPERKPDIFDLDNRRTTWPWVEGSSGGLGAAPTWACRPHLTLTTPIPRIKPKLPPRRSYGGDVADDK